MKEIFSELTAVWDMQNKQSVDNLIFNLEKRLYLGPIIGIGAGRMGYSLRAFIMRLSHMGCSAYFIGDTSVPRADELSTILMSSSSGETPSNILYAKQAIENKSKLILFTQNTASTLGKLADCVVEIPQLKSTQLMKTLPEQYTMLLFDYIINRLVELTETSPSKLSMRHSIFE